MNFWDIWKIKLEYENEKITLKLKAYTLIFDIPNTPKEEWEYYYNNGFEYAFEEIIY